MGEIDVTLVLTGIISGAFGLLVALLPKLSASWMKKRENGALAARNLALREIDVEQLNIERLAADNDRLRERVDKLERGIQSSNLRNLEYQALLFSIEEDVRVLREGFRSITHPEAKALDRVAIEMQERIRRGRQLGGVA